MAISMATLRPLHQSPAYSNTQISHTISSPLPPKSVRYSHRSASNSPLKFSSGFLGQGSRTLILKSLGNGSDSFRGFKNPSVQAVASDLQAKPTVLVAEKLGEAGLDLLRTVANVDCSYSLSQEELCTKISLCDALIVRSGTKVTREVFQSSQGRLKVVGRAGVGIDNVDLHAATEFGCLVVNAPTANTVAAAEHGIALIAAMARNVPSANASMKEDLRHRFYHFLESV